jgi:hypothetical protein
VDRKREGCVVWCKCENENEKGRGVCSAAAAWREVEWSGLDLT